MYTNRLFLEKKYVIFFINLFYINLFKIKLKKAPLKYDENSIQNTKKKKQHKKKFI